ncbi:MAG: hypothetical protein E7016_07250 [Alphaproteobacteria bacterium]|nr:hypothetical protein [Alphaproteobacteria bacterium]
MRKYFLLSAVALMTATNVNAATDYAEVTAKATIQKANLVTCDELNWGTITIKQDNAAFTLDSTEPGTGFSDLISISGGNSQFTCNSANMTSLTKNNEGSLYLVNENGAEMSLEVGDVWEMDGKTYFATQLHIPEDVEAGTYTGTFTAFGVY